MKKQKVLRRKIKKMSYPTTVTTAPPNITPVDVPTPKYKSTIGIILQSLITTLTPPKSNLARIVSQPPAYPSSVPINMDGSVDWDTYVAFCKGKGVEPRPFHVAPGDDETAYKHYVSFCEAVGVEPRSIERWVNARKVDLRIAYKLVWERVKNNIPIKTYTLYSLTLGNYLARSAKCLRLFRDDLKTPRNIEKRFGFGYDATTEKLRVTPEWADGEKYDPKTTKPRGEKAHALNCEVWKNAQLCTCDGKKLPLASKWCSRCEEYVEQSHEECNLVFRKRRNADLESLWNYNATTEALHKAHTWERVAGAQLRKLKTYYSQDYGTPSWPETPPKVEAEWQRELATWSRFVPYKGEVNKRFCPHHWWDARYCTACVCGLGEPQPNVDQLAWVKSDPRSCKHRNVREFTFSTGETVTLCPDCDKVTGNKVFRVGNIVAYPTPGARVLFEARLEAEGLSMWRGFSKKLVYRGTPIVLEKFGVEKEEESLDTAVNTSGISGTDREGDGARDSCDRDRRGKQMLDAENTHEPLARCFDPYSGETFWERDGTVFRPGTSHKQRFHEELPTIHVDLQLFRLKSTLLILKELQEKKQ